MNNNALKITGIALASATFLLSGAVAMAEETTTNVRPAVTAVTAEKTDARNVEKKKMEAKREEMNSAMEAKREEAKTRMEASREDAKNKMEKMREENQMRMEERKAKADERIAKIKDDQKQKLAERISEQFDELNKKWTDHFINVLDRLDEIVIKVRARADSFSANGADTTDINVAIKKAEEAVASARTAVVSQAGKTYAPDLATPIIDSAAAAATNSTGGTGQDELIRTMKAEFNAIRATLHGDLTALRDGSMRDARDAVHTAIQTLKKTDHSESNNEPVTTTTGSGAQ